MVHRYSWGACLAAEAAQLEDVKAYIGISPVTGTFTAALQDDVPWSA